MSVTFVFIVKVEKQRKIVLFIRAKLKNIRWPLVILYQVQIIFLQILNLKFKPCVIFRKQGKFNQIFTYFNFAILLSFHNIQTCFTVVQQRFCNSLLLTIQKSFVDDYNPQIYFAFRCIYCTFTADYLHPLPPPFHDIYVTFCALSKRTTGCRLTGCL